MKEYIVKTLEKLVHIPSVSGDYEGIQEFLLSELRAMDSEQRVEVKTFNRGGVLLKLQGESSDHASLLAAHMDTLGAMVKSIREDGKVLLAPVGGYSLLTILGNYCTIHSAEKTHQGTVVFDNGSVHANSRDFEKKPFDYKSIMIRLDEHVKSRKDVEALGIGVGDYISWDPRFTVTEQGFVKSRHLDDKLGVALLLGALKEMLQKERLKRDVYFFFSVWEEVGFGANFTFPKEIKEVVIVDNGVLGSEQESDEYSVTICAKDSTGPFHPEMKKKLVQLAKEKSIQYKVDTYPHYGSDAATMLRAANDFKTILISPGVDNSHAYERTTLTSIEQSYQLIKAYLLA